MDDRHTIESELGRRLLLGEVAARNARKFPDKEALVYGDQRLTFGEFNSRVNKLAQAFLDLGIERGSKVAVMSFNCSEFLEIYFALGKIGGVTVPLNFRLHGEELVYIVNHSDAQAFVVGEPLLPMVEPMRKDFVNVRDYISITGEPIEGMKHYETWIAGYPDDEPLVLVDDDDPLFIMYTAGTTGRPKGAVLTHKNEITMWMLVSMFAMSEPGIGDLSSYRCFVPPPIFHLAGFGIAQLAFFAGATVILSPQVFDPTDIMQTIEREEVSAILLIPAMANFLLQLPDLDKYDTSSLKVWVSGAAILPTATRQQIVKHFPNVRIFDVFGQTEMSPVVCGLRHSEAEGRETSVGKPLSFIEVRVLDDDGRDVPLGQVGEAVYRGPNVMKEYYKEPEATAEAMRGGWFHSTDMVRQDEEGYIYIVDRKKDMIISGGENIYPAEIEEALYKNAKVLECAVIGVFDEEWGEAVKACVVCKPGETMTDEEVIEYCKKHLGSYKKPRSVDFMEALPRNAAGKVLKRVLKEKYGSSLRY